MSPNRAMGGSVNSVLFVSVAIVLVAMTGVAAFTIPRSSNPQGFVGPKSVTTESAGGLLLGLSMNETTIAPGQTIGITVYERNTFQKTNNVSASDGWPVSGLSVGPCGVTTMPMGIALYQGNWSMLTNSGAQPLQLYKPGPYYCPAIMGGVRAYVFQPTSVQAQVIGPCSPNPCFISNMSSTIDARGYWSTGLIQFSDFSPGVYTVVAGDEWGNVLLLRFEVGSGSTTPLSSSACSFPLYLSTLAAQVQTNQRFTSQQHGLSYVLAYGDNESGTTGQVNGRPYSTPPETALTFYSYGAEPFNACPNNFPSSPIVGVLWVHVPLSPNGSYNLSNMSVYFTPGLFTNSTSTMHTT